MAHLAAPNNVWDDAKSWSTNNRTLRVPTLADIEPCAALRQELMHARRHIAALETRAGPPAAPSAPQTQKVMADDPGLVVGESTFNDGLSPDQRTAALNAAFEGINDKTLVVEANSKLQLNCGGMLRPANNVAATLRGGAPSIGGVFLLVGENGMKVSFELIEQADAPKRTVYGPSPLNANQSLALPDLMRAVRAHAARPGTQVFASEGTLVVPCAVYTGPAVLYGRKGILFRGNTMDRANPDTIHTL